MRNYTNQVKIVVTDQQYLTCKNFYFILGKKFDRFQRKVKSKIYYQNTNNGD